MEARRFFSSQRSQTPSSSASTFDINPTSPEAEFWSPGQSISVVTPPSSRQPYSQELRPELGLECTMTTMPPSSLPSHSYNTLHSTPNSMRSMSAPSLIQIVESQKKLETMMIAILERVTSLESRSLMTMYPAQGPSAGSFSSSSPSEIEKKESPS